jgi:inhibitor of cysteine peptidase
MNASRRKRRSRRRSPRVEQLERRLVFSFVASDMLWNPGYVAARDDGFAIEKDSVQRELDVLENDRAWAYVRNSEVEDLEIAVEAEHGSAEVSEDGSHVLYQPDADFVGIDRFTYTIHASGKQMEADVFINVVEPLFAFRDWFHVDEDSSANELDVLQNDIANAHAFDQSSAGDESQFTILSVTEGSDGGEILVSEDGRRLLYAPDSGFEGLETFTYVIQNDEGYTSEARVQVQVTTLVENGETPVWREQLEQRLLELAVQQNSWRFGNFQSTDSVYMHYERDWTDSILRVSPPPRPPIVWNSSTTVTGTLTGAVAQDAAQNAVTEFLSSDAGYSVTNNQIEGVDEGDLVKTDGHYLYMISNWTSEDGGQHHQLVIVDVRDPEDPAVLSRYTFGGTAESLHLRSDRVTVLSQSDDEILVTVLDVSNRHDPTLAYESTVSGQLQATRMIEDHVYVVADTSRTMVIPNLETVCYSDNVGCFFETASQFASRIEDTLADVFDVEIETRDASGVITTETTDLATTIDLDDMLNFGLSTVVSFDVSGNASGPSDTTSWVRESTSDIYVSANAIYMMNETSERSSNWSRSTRIEKLSLGSGGQVDWVASGSVEGHVLNSFSVDEHNGSLRIATNTGSGNDLHILQQSDDHLEVVGSVEDLAHGERIYSARFDGDRAFVVTYRKVDPLFVFDLSDPTDPKVLGELKISGYSNYLHLIDENHLLGIGREANGGGLFQEMQVSLFDISDLENPEILHRYEFEGGRQLWSPLMEDAWNLGTHHAVSYFASHQALVLPVYEGDSAWWSWKRGGAAADVSMRVLDIDIDDGITALGRVDFEEAFDPHLARSVRVGGVLYSISPDMVLGHELQSPENKISEVRIGSGATDDVFSMRASESGELDVLANDGTSSVAVSNRQIVSIEQPSVGGQVEINAGDGTLSFVPDLAFRGPAKFSYVTETDGHREKATVRVDVRRAWHNSGNPMDVNHDNAVTPRDMVQVVNVLNSWGSGSIDSLETEVADTDGSARLVDTNNDGRVTARDLLFLVNHFLRHTDEPTGSDATLQAESAIDQQQEAMEPGAEELFADSPTTQAIEPAGADFAPITLQPVIESDDDAWSTESVDEAFTSLELFEALG